MAEFGPFSGLPDFVERLKAGGRTENQAGERPAPQRRPLHRAGASVRDGDMIFDVVIIGGAFSGAATGLLLKRRQPELKVLIVEKAAEFDRKVGESTTEVSSCFLTRVLGIGTYLGHHQLNKQGLRMWFSRTPEEPFEHCVEMGARYNSRLSGFQVDRATLDEHVLKLAVEAGCDLWRPAKVGALDLGGIGKNSLEVQVGAETRNATAKWVIDASGRAAIVARKLGLLQPLGEHPINALWGRFTGSRDWDGHELRMKYPCWAEAARTGRGWATNHLMGLGWWCWIIPLKGGDTSIGLVYDTRLFQPPEGATIAERLKAHLQTHPVGRRSSRRCKSSRAISARTPCCPTFRSRSWARGGRWWAMRRRLSIRFISRGWIFAPSRRMRRIRSSRVRSPARKSRRRRRTITSASASASGRGSMGSTRTSITTWAMPN